MDFEFELYYSYNGTKMVYVSAYNDATGAEYPYETAEDIGKAIAGYLTQYYSHLFEPSEVDDNVSQ